MGPKRSATQFFVYSGREVDETGPFPAVCVCLRLLAEWVVEMCFFSVCRPRSPNLRSVPVLLSSTTAVVLPVRELTYSSRRTENTGMLQSWPKCFFSAAAIFPVCVKI
ncbi:unnamed protein product [Pylaiella littoralis]